VSLFLQHNTTGFSMRLASLSSTLRSSSQLLLYQPATRINFQLKAYSIMAPSVSE